MSCRQILIVGLVLSTLMVPIVQLSIGFYYINSAELCPLEPDIMFLTAIGGLFYIIFFGVGFVLIFSLAPSAYKQSPNMKTTDQANSEFNNRASKILISLFDLLIDDFFVLVPNWYCRFHYKYIRCLCHHLLCSHSNASLWKFFSKSDNEFDKHGNLLYIYHIFKRIWPNDCYLCCHSVFHCNCYHFVTGNRRTEELKS